MSGKKILIVEDDRDQIRGLALRLKANGYQVFSALDGTTAFTQACKLLPDLILLDIGLPAGDGFKVVEWLAGTLNTSMIPVIVLTGRDPYVARDRSLRLGAKAFFQKPADNEALLATIGELMGAGVIRDQRDEPVETKRDEPVGIRRDEPVGIRRVEPVGIRRVEPVGIRRDAPVGIRRVEAGGIRRVEAGGIRRVEPVETKRVEQVDGPPVTAVKNAPPSFMERRLNRWREELLATPGDTELMNDIAWLLATAHDPKLRNTEEAMQLVDQALSLMKTPSVAILDTQAAILAATGRFSEALDAARKGLAMAQISGQSARTYELTSRIRLYEAKQAYVDSNY